MSIKSSLLACTSILAIALSTTAFADTMGGGSYTYQPGSFVDGHFYTELNLDYSRLLLKLNTPAGAPAALGVNSKNIDSFIFGGELGYALNHDYSIPVRLGLNLMYRPGKNFNITPIYSGSSNYGNGQIQTTLLLANAYYDFYNQSGYIPYVGLGAGLARNKIQFEINNTATNAVVNATSSTSNNSFAWDATLGAWTNLMDNLDGDLYVRYTYLGKPNSLNSRLASGVIQTNALISHLYSADLGLGFRYNFG